MYHDRNCHNIFIFYNFLSIEFVLDDSVQLSDLSVQEVFESCS